MHTHLQQQQQQQAQTNSTAAAAAAVADSKKKNVTYSSSSSSRDSRPWGIPLRFFFYIKVYDTKAIQIDMLVQQVPTILVKMEYFVRWRPLFPWHNSLLWCALWTWCSKKCHLMLIYVRATILIFYLWCIFVMHDSAISYLGLMCAFAALFFNGSFSKLR